ncbi:hypothetical protein ACFE04_008171 [Oxalis oulophora]
MERLKKFILLFASFALHVVVLVHAQDQTGFISLACGTKSDTNFTETTTGINYISDANYVEAGIGFTIENSVLQQNYQQQFWNLRSFPDGTRNCYSLNLTKGDKYLIRANFLYGNYDQKNQTPEFDIHIGPNFWTTMKIEYSSTSYSVEIIHVLTSDYLDVCLINTGLGTPFMSALELRLLPSNIYPTQSVSLQLSFRADVGSNATIGMRYSKDIYDRYWNPSMPSEWKQITVPDNFSLSNGGGIDFASPKAVMRNAVTPENVDDPLSFKWSSTNTNDTFYVYMYFAELEILQNNETREFTITSNSKPWLDGNYQPSYLTTVTIYSLQAVTSTDGNFTFEIAKTGISTHPPILNALEAYKVIKFPQTQTHRNDTRAIKNIKAMYGLKRNWQGDPCAPLVYMWEGLNCSDLNDDPPRITSLNLSSSGLNGEIPQYISNLTSLQVLILSNNSFTGSVPDFLGNLSSLKILNLEDNKLSGSVPAKLLEKQTAGSLELSIEGNRDLCKSLTCKKKSSVVIPVVASVASVCVLIVVVMAILWIYRKRRTGETDSTSIMMSDSFEKKVHKFTFSDIERITRNFERVVGKGGFGSVYLGYLDDSQLSQVAVKMLSNSSSQGYQQFEAEVNLLLKVYHKNLTTLVGYCFDGTNMGLIYEFMSNGDLAEHVSASKNNLNWEIRLRIALETALGLEYLHNGCKPPIIHRDVKCTNILLDDKFQAKLADFGLSRSFPTETGTDHLSTMVVGTPGYLDPEYFTSNRLTEKSDVYSFGVVLMEITTGRPVIAQNHSHERFHISEYVGALLSKGDVRNVVDPRLEGDVDLNTVWKVLELAMTCVSTVGSRRPTMSEIVSELNDCLETEKSRRKGVYHHNTEEYDSLLTLNLEEEPSAPLAR